jgi:molecular chaperone DnaK (HSP70)
MNSNQQDPMAIKVGVDLGSARCRAAYVLPRGDGAVVSVPMRTTDFQPFFPLVEPLQESLPYQPRFFPSVIQRLRPEFRLDIMDTQLESDKIVALLLSRISRAAASFAGETVTGMVVSHPVWADAAMRELLRNGIAASGHKDGALCSDVEAACASFRTQNGKNDVATVLAISAGYMGLGIAAARMTQRSVRILAENGDQGTLAGNVLDYALVQGAFHCLEAHHIPIAAGDPIIWNAVHASIDRVKQAISSGESVEFSLPGSLTPEHRNGLRMIAHGNKFRQVVDEHVAAALSIIDHVLVEADTKPEEIRHILLIGGTTYLPEVAPVLHGRFPGAEIRHLPDESIATGAALLAHERSFAETLSSTGPAASSRPYRPTRPLQDGIVELVEPRRNADGASRNTESHPVQAPEQDLDKLTLASVRALSADHARRALERLREAVDMEIKRLDERR